MKLLANRLALSVATATSKLEGRLAREADICKPMTITIRRLHVTAYMEAQVFRGAWIV